MLRWPGALVCSFLMLQSGSTAVTQQHGDTPAARTAVVSIDEKISGARKMPGFFDMYWDADQGRLWLEIDMWDEEFIYQSSLPAGIGSNDIGLDRGQMGATRLVRFTRIGTKVLLIQSNTGYRAVTDDKDEQRAVRDSFAESTLWGFTVAATDGDRVLVDATEFALHDAHGVPATLLATRQGTYRLDAARSAVYLPRTKNFPSNTEMEATLTFAGDAPGPWVRQVTPSPDSITLREHHSFVKLPPSGYKPRLNDPRSGYYGVSYQDYASPIGEPLVTRFLARHRLQKKDPKAPVSDVVKPIVYYLDRGTPEPIRAALLDGARWWAEAFEAAGFRNAYRVEMLPEDADPMDLRYNVIQWVHRATRGWSYGLGVVDPRTGEIIKGHVSLGSLRVRHDYLIAEGLLAPYEKGEPVSTRMLTLALARLRQLSAHEVGHTLGLEHNYSASTVNRSSVMDYPPPVATLAADGTIDVSRAYATGLGAWDMTAIAFGYSEFAPGIDEPAALNGILNAAFARGLRYLTDQDARPAGSSSTLAHLWDAGDNAIDELNRLMRVREAALRRFGEENIPEGAPLSRIEDALTPIYLLHRYQTEAACKLVGGLDYTHAVRGDAQGPPKITPAAEQRRALAAVLETLSPETLALPDRLLEVLPPRPPDMERGREHFRVHTSPAFDALAPAEAAARLTMHVLLNPERAARLVEFHARDAENPSLGEVLDTIIGQTWKRARPAGYAAEIARVVDDVVLDELMRLSADETASYAVRALAGLKLEELKTWTMEALSPKLDEATRAHLTYASTRIARFQKEPAAFLPREPTAAPDGPPIGGNGCLEEDFVGLEDFEP